MDEDPVPDMTVTGEVLVLRQIVSSPKVLSKTMSLPAGSLATKLFFPSASKYFFTSDLPNDENFYSEPFTDKNIIVFSLF